MRNVLTAAALVAAFMIAGNAMAQSSYWQTTWDSPSVSWDVEDLGLDADSTENVLFNKGTSQSVDNLYLKSPVAVSNSGGTTHINHLWVTTETVGTGSNFTGTGGTIGDFTLYVGEQQVMGKTFGVPTAESVTMSGVALAGVSATFGTTWEFTTGNRYLVNDGRINNLAYNGGNYSGSGTVGTLTAGTTLVGSNIKQADALAFDARYETNGGLITLAGTGNFDTVTYDVSGLDGLETQAIDFTNAPINVALGQDLAEISDGISAFDSWVGRTDGAGNMFTFDFGDIFGVTATGLSLAGFADFNILFGDAVAFSIFDIASSALLSGWNWAEGNDYITYTATNAPPVDPSPVPEPATLAMLGLGLAGLGLVSRRRRK